MYTYILQGNYSQIPLCTVWGEKKPLLQLSQGMGIESIIEIFNLWWK